MFASVRERRLWIVAAAVVAAIYSTLGPARALAGALRDREMLDNTMFLGFLLIVGAIAAQAVKARWGRMEIDVALGVLAVCLMALLRMAIPDERTHSSSTASWPSWCSRPSRSVRDTAGECASQPSWPSRRPRWSGRSTS